MLIVCLVVAALYVSIAAIEGVMGARWIGSAWLAAGFLALALMAPMPGMLLLMAGGSACFYDHIVLAFEGKERRRFHLRSAAYWVLMIGVWAALFGAGLVNLALR